MDNKWNKYDIDNGVLSYFQRDTRLSMNKYLFLTKIRDEMII